MSSQAWWDSYERMDRSYRLARTTAVASFGVAIVGWGLWLRVIAVPASVLTLSAVLLTLFTWFRRDDLGRSMNGPRRNGTQ